MPGDRDQREKGRQIRILESRGLLDLAAAFVEYSIYGCSDVSISRQQLDRRSVRLDGTR